MWDWYQQGVLAEKVLETPFLAVFLVNTGYVRSQPFGATVLDPRAHEAGALGGVGFALG